MGERWWFATLGVPRQAVAVVDVWLSDSKLVAQELEDRTGGRGALFVDTGKSNPRVLDMKTKLLTHYLE